MGKLVEVVEAEPWHIDAIAARARHDDVEEVWASVHSTFAEALRHALVVSTKAWTGQVDGVPVVMFGVAPISAVGGVGAPWLLGSVDVERHQKAFLRRNKAMVGEMLDLYPRLENYVDDRNSLSIKWLQWLGFAVGSPQPYGIEQLPFRHFTMGD